MFLGSRKLALKFILLDCKHTYETTNMSIFKFSCRLAEVPMYSGMLGNHALCYGECVIVHSGTPEQESAACYFGTFDLVENIMSENIAD